MFKQIRKVCGIDLNVLIRPRFGDFLYTETEFKMIQEDILMFRELGADGIVAGCLRADGNLDICRMKELLMAQSDLGVDIAVRNVYILDSSGTVLDGSNQTAAVSMTPNLLTALNGAVEDSMKTECDSETKDTPKDAYLEELEKND